MIEKFVRWVIKVFLPGMHLHKNLKRRINKSEGKNGRT